MCSYNRINQTYGCQNSKILNGLLKAELGFQGYVMADWGATHSGVTAVNAGEDMDMPGTDQMSPVFWHQNLTDSVKNGSISSNRLDDMCRRVMTPYFNLHQEKGFPAVDPSEKELNALLFSSRESICLVYLKHNLKDLQRTNTNTTIPSRKRQTSTSEANTAPRSEKPGRLASFF